MKRMLRSDALSIEGKYIVIAILVACAVGVLSYKFTFTYCKNILGTAIVTSSNSGAVAPGYVLIAPYITGNFYNKAGTVQLVDTNGTVVHTWTTQYPVLYSILEPSGSLFVEETPPSNLLAAPSAGGTGLIQELSWDGRVLWEYSNNNLTHDFEPLPNENIALLTWDKMPINYAQKVRGGFTTSSADIWTESITIINKEKQVVWTWHMYDHLDPSQYVLNSFTPVNDWSHANSIRYTGNNPITHTPAFLVSVRDVSRLIIVDAASGNVIWESPMGMTSFQHDATFLENGDILVFDNGFFRQQPQAYLWSRAVEIDPKTNKIVWQYNEGGNPVEQLQFASSIMGGAQRLENGDTLITFSTQNRIIEVNQKGTIVWDYTNRFTDQAGLQYLMFKTRKYSPRGTEWGKYVGGISSSIISAICK